MHKNEQVLAAMFIELLHRKILSNKPQNNDYVVFNFGNTKYKKSTESALTEENSREKQGSSSKGSPQSQYKKY
jgi:hypothetical protein